MLVLPVRDVVIQLYHGIVLGITFGEETVSVFVGDDETQTKAEDDAELEAPGGHADDDPGSVDGGFLNGVSAARQSSMWKYEKHHDHSPLAKKA
jgi:hypothetical protein